MKTNPSGVELSIDLEELICVDGPDPKLNTKPSGVELLKDAELDVSGVFDGRANTNPSGSELVIESEDVRLELEVSG